MALILPVRANIRNIDKFCHFVDIYEILLGDALFGQFRDNFLCQLLLTPYNAAVYFDIQADRNNAVTLVRYAAD